MAQTLQFVVFHGSDDSSKTYNVVNPTGDSQNVQSSTQTVYNLISGDKGTSVTQIVTTPLRFKRQDNDSQDLSNPIPIPDTQGNVNYSYRKIYKVGVSVPSDETSGSLMNLRFYVDTGKTDTNGDQVWDDGTYLYLGIDSTFKPQSQNDQTQTSPFNGEITSENALTYTSTNMKTIVSGTYYDKSTDPSQTDDTKYFGTQPYLYLQQGVDNTQVQGRSSTVGAWYVYDEI